MKTPPEYLMPILHQIEDTVIHLSKEFPKLSDKEIELSYNQLKTYYQKQSRSSGSVEEPLASSDRRQALIDEIMNTLDFRKEEALDDAILGSFHGNQILKNHEQLYHLALKRLHKSVRLWKSEGGYLNFIKSQMT